MSAEHAPVTPIRDIVPATPATEMELVDERASLQADVEFIKERIAQIDAQLIERLPVGVTEIGDTKVEVREYSRLDTKWIEENYPVSQYPQLYKVTAPAVDAAAVRKQFAPAVLEEHKVRGAKSIVIR
ncbi:MULTISPECIES: hypothetical protein [unclassified Microbacterium]|uniref:hypothetical protein n=1 Tax=unclassified Microbacterium TaxID=2609290 RepID=UPI003C2C61B6